MITKIKNYIGVKNRTKIYPEWTGWKMTERRRMQMQQEIAEFLAYGEDADKTPDEVACTIVAIVDKFLNQEEPEVDTESEPTVDAEPMEEEPCQN